MNDTFIVEEEADTRRSSAVLTGWETVIFEVEDEPPYDVFVADS